MTIDILRCHKRLVLSLSRIAEIKKTNCPKGDGNEVVMPSLDTILALVGSAAIFLVARSSFTSVKEKIEEESRRRALADGDLIQRVNKLIKEMKEER